MIGKLADIKRKKKKLRNPEFRTRNMNFDVPKRSTW